MEKLELFSEKLGETITVVYVSDDACELDIPGTNGNAVLMGWMKGGWSKDGGW